MRLNSPDVTLASVRATHRERRREIRNRLNEFREVWERRSDSRLFEELAYCIFTGGCSARMGMKSVEAIRHLLPVGGREQMTVALVAARAHRYPTARPGYIVATREFLDRDCGRRLGDRLARFDCPNERRDWLARERGIKGIGYKEASHFLRNVGFSGYAILDKHVLRALAKLGVVVSPKPPTTRARYLDLEDRMKKFASAAKIDFDELDLVLWSMNTGEILK